MSRELQKAYEKVNQSKMSALLQEKPITLYVSGESDRYSDYYWQCPDNEREEILHRMDEHDYTEDDYDNQGYEIQVTERDEAKPDKDDFYKISDFIAQTARREDVDHTSMVDTGRYIEIGIHDKDASIIVYESVPKDGKHEFWQVDTKDNNNCIIQLARDQYDIKRTLPADEAAKYQDARDSIAFKQQVKDGVFPKKMLELASKIKSHASDEHEVKSLHTPQLPI